jgi:ABC-2 type transport system permease protein
MNLVGMRTLLFKEIWRFLRVPTQTLLSPLVTTALYFLVFGYSLGWRAREELGVAYPEFIVPGLVFLGLANAAFNNSSSSLFVSKLQGTVVDLLVAPLGPSGILTGYVLGAVVRGLMVGLLTFGVATAFNGFRLEHPGWSLGLLFLNAWLFATLGLLAAIWANTFEQINLFPTLVMTPLTFLGGVFYSVHALPEPWRRLSEFNPVVYLVDVLRHAVLGRGLYSPTWSGGLLLLVACGSTLLAYGVLRSGAKLKS